MFPKNIFKAYTLDMATDPIKSNRTSNVELPSGTEIKLIAAAEMQRPHSPGKDGVRYVEFGSIAALCSSLNIETSFFELETRSPEEILYAGNRLLDELVFALSVESPRSEIIDHLDECYRYLSASDKPMPSDAIFVFGSTTPLRIESAIDLYNRGLAPKLLISGRGPFYGKTEDVTEAKKYAELAIIAGVPQSDIILEEESITLVDNIRRSLNILDSLDIKLNSVIIVNSPYTQRRGWCMWRKYLPDSAKLYRVNSETGPNFKPNTWYLNESGIRVVLGEFIKLRNGVAFDSV